MAPKKSCKVVQKTMVEEPAQDPNVPPQAMSGEEQKGTCERAPTPPFSAAFYLGSHLSPFKELGVPHPM